MSFLERIKNWFGFGNDNFAWDAEPAEPASPTKSEEVDGGSEQDEDNIPKLCFPNGRGCPHEPANGIITVVVLGKPCEFDSPPMCKDCTEKYLNKYATMCIACKMPILPGDPVGDPSGALTSIGSKLAHLAEGCCDTGGFYCGNWGEGRLVRLYEIDPDQFPEGTTTVMALAFTSGKPVVVNTY